MQIQDQKVVTLDYTLKDKSGEIIDSTNGAGDFHYLHGANNIIPGLESALMGKSKGDEVSVVIQPEQGYGLRNESLIQIVPRDAFETEDEIQVGMQFHTQTNDGNRLVITITKIDGFRL